MTAKLTNHVRDFGRNAAELNEALMLGLVRQHGLTEAAELLNAQLQAEIVARKKAEEALVNSEKLASVGRMAAVLSHEINNPLEAVMNTLYLAQTTENLSTVREYLVIADGELKRIAHITRQTLGFYRESVALTTFRVASLFESVCDLLQAKMLSKRTIVRKQCDEHLEINGFQGEVRQVLSNLVVNSLDAVAENGQVTVRAAHSVEKDGNSRIRISVADNGQGISHAALGKIFEPFFTTKGSIGNGLGLWVGKQIVEKHGGFIQVHSCMHGPQQGTHSRLFFPRR